jgi:hypothetical protein
MDPAKASALARDPRTPAETLETLAAAGLPFLREYVAVHPNATADLLRRLAPTTLRTENDVALARALTTNEATPSDAIGGLLEAIGPDAVDGSRRENRPHEELALRLLAHPNCPEDAAARFVGARDLPRPFRVSLAQGVASSAILEALAADPSAVVRAIAEERLRGIGAGRAPAVH